MRAADRMVEDGPVAERLGVQGTGNDHPHPGSTFWLCRTNHDTRVPRCHGVYPTQYELGDDAYVSLNSLPKGTQLRIPSIQPHI